jgi:hypothetical protein
VKPDSAFALLLDRQSSAEERERLTLLRDQLALADNDALWGLLAIIEDHCASLVEHREAGGASRSEARSTPGWHFVALGMAVQVLLLGAGMVVGARAVLAPPTAWIRSQPSTASDPLLGSVLQAPAGWVALLFALPLLLHAIQLGWRVRREAPALGWTIVGAASVTIAVCMGLLLWLT